MAKVRLHVPKLTMVLTMVQTRELTMVLVGAILYKIAAMFAPDAPFLSNSIWNPVLHSGLAAAGINASSP